MKWRSAQRSGIVAGDASRDGATARSNRSGSRPCRRRPCPCPCAEALWHAPGSRGPPDLIGRDVETPYSGHAAQGALSAGHLGHASRPPRAVTHAQNADMVAGNPISDDVRVNQRPLTQSGAGNRPAAVGKGSKAIARREQRSGDGFCRAGVKLDDVGVNPSYVPERSRRPDYLHGGGTTSPLASFSSHSRTFSCGIPNPASISASASAIARASASSSTSSKTDFVSSIQLPAPRNG